MRIGRRHAKHDWRNDQPGWRVSLGRSDGFRGSRGDRWHGFVTDTASTNMVTTVKKNGTECYSFETQYSESTATLLPMVLKNSTGTTVADYVPDSSDGTATITCSGGSPVVVSLDCGSSLPDGSTVSCTTVTCTP